MDDLIGKIYKSVLAGEPDSDRTELWNALNSERHKAEYREEPLGDLLARHKRLEAFHDQGDAHGLRLMQEVIKERLDKGEF